MGPPEPLHVVGVFACNCRYILEFDYLVGSIMHPSLMNLYEREFFFICVLIVISPDIFYFKCEIIMYL